MRRIILSVFSVAILAGAATAQSTPAVSTPAPQGTAAPDAASQAQNAKPFPVGTPIAVELSKPLDAKKAKTGDKIEAKFRRTCCRMDRL